jgi:hypothetical protein
MLLIKFSHYKGLIYFFECIFFYKEIKMNVLKTLIEKTIEKLNFYYHEKSIVDKDFLPDLRI